MLLRTIAPRRMVLASRCWTPVPVSHLSMPALKSRSYASVSDKPPEFMEKLMDSPKAINSISRLMDLLEKKGVDVKSGTPPSMMQMAKIAMDSEIRSATGEGELEREYK
jgi:hypothetical protein